ncbi:ABC transporter G family member 15 [Leucoagaricus sp. SymC.cos]|nr:ABC transporter G family member 15 [Leucoagaricus sp. SymC.cos]
MPPCLHYHHHHAASNALHRALNLASKKLFGTTWYSNSHHSHSHSGASAHSQSSAMSSPRRLIITLDVDDAVGSGRNGERDPMEDDLLAQLEELAQKTDVLTHWVDEMYDSTRGLDASTALEFVQALHIATDTFRLTTIVSIYQAGELLYKHFDKVYLVSKGKMAYFGPADRARQYFVDMGYEPAHRQTTADFLVAVTDPNGRTTRPGVIQPSQAATEFANYFKNSKFGKLNR